MNAPTAAPPLTELRRLLRAWARWQTGRRVLRWSLWGVTGGALLAALFGLVNLTRPHFLLAEYLWLALALVGGASAAAGLLAALLPTDWPRAAAFFDWQFGLRERVSTALELAADPAADPLWRDLQAADALRAARAVRPRHHLPLRPDRRTLIAATLSLLLLLGVSAANRPRFVAAAAARTAAAAVAAQEAALAALAAQIAADPALAAPLKEALLDVLEQGTARLDAAHTPEAALAALADTQAALESLAAADEAAQLAAQLEAMQAAAAAEDSASPAADVAAALAAGDLAGAAAALAGQSVADLPAAEQARLSAGLARLADALAAANPDLAAALQDAADALARGEPSDLAAAQAALDAAAAALDAQAGALSAAQAAAKAAALAAAQVGALAGSGPGAGQTGALGAGRGEGGGDLGTGPEAPAAPIPSDNGPGDGGERAYDPVYAPQNLGGDDTAGVHLDGSGAPGDQILGQGPLAPGAPGGSVVPYVDVLPSYLAAYRQALQGGQAPPHLRALIRDYFSSLQP
jgi:hypothetical protein